jgi:RimK family alpha-L-glutamate ligase
MRGTSIPTSCAHRCSRADRLLVAILSARSGWHTDELCRALVERGHVGEVAAYESLQARVGGKHESTASCCPPSLSTGARSAKVEGGPFLLGMSGSPDAVLARIIPNGSLEQIIFRIDALHWFEDRGIPVINSPKAIERSVDKFYTSAILHDNGIPTPETVVCEDFATAIAAVRDMGDVIVKPIFGSMGHGLVRIADPDIAFRVLRPLEQSRAVYYVQRAIDHDGRDIRAFVVDGRVIGAIERRAPDGDWRTNVSRGGSARPIELDDADRELAIRAGAAIGADYAGIDLLRARDGQIYVLEVNGIPGWQGLQRATGIDVAGAIVDLLVSKAG